MSVNRQNIGGAAVGAIVATFVAGLIGSWQQSPALAEKIENLYSLRGSDIRSQEKTDSRQDQKSDSLTSGQLAINEMITRILVKVEHIETIVEKARAEAATDRAMMLAEFRQRYPGTPTWLSGGSAAQKGSQ